MCGTYHLYQACSPARTLSKSRTICARKRESESHARPQRARTHDHTVTKMQVCAAGVSHGSQHSTAQHGRAAHVRTAHESFVHWLTTCKKEVGADWPPFVCCAVQCNGAAACPRPCRPRTRAAGPPAPPLPQVRIHPAWGCVARCFHHPQRRGCSAEPQNRVRCMCLPAVCWNDKYSRVDMRY
jgi:hypothetical protein